LEKRKALKLFRKKRGEPIMKRQKELLSTKKALGEDLKDGGEGEKKKISIGAEGRVHSGAKRGTRGCIERGRGRPRRSLAKRKKGEKKTVIVCGGGYCGQGQPGFCQEKAP